MEHAGAIAKRYLEWAKQQAEKAKQEQQKDDSQKRGHHHSGERP
jgi:hypothetical protein